MFANKISYKNNFNVTQMFANKITSVSPIQTAQSSSSLDWENLETWHMFVHLGLTLFSTSFHLEFDGMTRINAHS